MVRESALPFIQKKSYQHLFFAFETTQHHEYHDLPGVSPWESYGTRWSIGALTVRPHFLGSFYASVGESFANWFAGTVVRFEPNASACRKQK